MPQPSARFRQAVKDGRPLVLLAEIDHPDGFVRVWSGVGTLVYGGNEWAGLGQLGRVTPLQSEMQTIVFDFDIELRGLPADALGYLNENVRNRAATVWLAALDERLNLIPDPVQIASGVMDYQTLEVGEDGTATIKIRVIGGLWVLDTALNQAWTTEEQIKLYPGDTGFDLIPGLVNAQVNWKRE